MSGDWTLHHATQAEEPNVGCQEISVTTSPLTSGSLTPQIAILLIIMCGVQMSERPTKLLEGKDNSIYQFKQGDLWKGLQEILKLFRGYG